MYSMKEACTLTNMTYENLKFYCNEGLVPNVKRDRRNYRVFDEHDIKWIQSLNCLKSCGMSIAEMKQYLALCMEGEGTIPERKVILAEKKETLLQSMTCFSSFFKIWSNHILVLLPFPSRNGCAIFISTYFSMICSKSDCGICSI